jgi:hypothetical protein
LLQRQFVRKTEVEPLKLNRKYSYQQAEINNQNYDDDYYYAGAIDNSYEENVYEEEAPMRKEMV